MRIMCERVGIYRQINNHTNNRVSRCIEVSKSHCEKVFSGVEGEEYEFASVFLSLFTSYLPYAKDPPQLCLDHAIKRGRKVVQCYSQVLEPIEDRSHNNNNEVEATSDHGRRLLPE